MFRFRTTITLAVMTFITALAVLLIAIQIRTFNLTTEQAASAYMDAVSVKSFGRLQSQVSEIITLVGVLSTSPNLSDSDQRTETDRAIPMLKAALHALPQLDSIYVGYDSGSWLQLQAVQQAGTTDVDAVRQAMHGQRVKAPSGFEEVMHPNHHLSKPVMIGKLNPLGRFDIVWQSVSPIRADAWSKYIPDSAKRTADWSFPWVCGGCVEPTSKE